MSVHTKLQAARRTDRKRVLMIATMISCGGKHRVRIRDFSPTGAQIVSEDPLSIGCDVLLKRGELCAAAHVVWVKGDEVGLTFYRPVSDEDLAGI